MLVSTQAAGLREIIMHVNVARNLACLTAKGIMNVYPCSPFYITIANFAMVDVNLSNHQKVAEVVNAPQEMVDIKDKCLSYLSGAKATISNNFVNAAHYKPTSDRLKEMAEHEATKRKDKETLKKIWIEDLQLLSKIKDHRSAFL